MDAAARAALMAPGLPMANVETGMPPGIWTIDNKLSMPFRALLSMGTPKTGNVVIEATMPGKWAAPPAAAMMTWNPLDFADLANSYILSGVRWADTILQV